MTTTEVINKLERQAEQILVVSGSSEIGGNVTVQGGKNTANKLIAATVAIPGKYIITNFPIILDPLELVAIAEYLGAVVTIDESRNELTIDTAMIVNKNIPYEMTRSTTSAFGFAGALLGRFGSVDIGKPGGDQIGARPIDLHVECFEALGAVVKESDLALTARFEDTTASEELEFSLSLPSTGAAVNALLAAVGKRLKLTLHNCPRDIDILNMCRLLEACGVVIEIDDTTIVVDARRLVSSTEVTFACAADRNDAFTWLCFGTMSRSGLRVNGLDPVDLASGIAVLRSTGALLDVEESSVTIRRPAEGLRAPAQPIIVGLTPQPHSDWAPLLAVVLCGATGDSRIIDTLFSNRVRQIDILTSMGAKATYRGGEPPKDVKLRFKVDPLEANYITDINGPNQLHGVSAAVGYDVRACAAAVLAASIAKGESQLTDMRALYRGYQNVLDRLTDIGVSVKLV